MSCPHGPNACAYKGCGPLAGLRSIYSSNPILLKGWQGPPAKEALLFHSEQCMSSCLEKEEQQTLEMISLAFIINSHKLIKLII
jgi:hypothetical protein